MAKLIKIYPENPNSKAIEQVVSVLKNGGLIIYPTDTVYSLGCDLMQAKSIEKVARIKGLKPEKADFSLIFNDLSQLSEFTKPISNSIYKLLKRCLPGAYTFILEANNAIPKIFKSNKKTVGIRIPDNNIPRQIVALLGNPIISTSIHDDDEILEYTTDPELIFEKYQNQVDLVIDGGLGNLYASTVVDLSNGEPEIIREGIGPVDDVV